jgi:hypothetical protein
LRAISSSARSAAVSSSSPPSASISGTTDGAMKIGSIAIALSAEYGEFCPPAISFSGSSCTNEKPASAIHSLSVGRSHSSPMPQLRRDGIEKSGTSIPA